MDRLVMSSVSLNSCHITCAKPPQPTCHHLSLRGGAGSMGQGSCRLPGQQALGCEVYVACHLSSPVGPAALHCPHKWQASRMQTLLEPVLLPNGTDPSDPSTVQQACVQLWAVGSAEEDRECRCCPRTALQEDLFQPRRSG